jgi:TPR repeat protein
MERRRNRRITPDPFLVLRLPADNQGIVLDVSAGGLGFLACEPVEVGQTIHFKISGKSMADCEATGQLVWKDSTGKRAGLKLTSLPDELRWIIRRLTQVELPNSSRLDPGVDSEANRHLRARNQGSRHDFEAGDFHHEKDPQVAQRLSEVASQGADQRLRGGRPNHLNVFSNILAGALACLIAMAVWYSFNRHAALGSAAHLDRYLASLFSSRGATHKPTRDSLSVSKPVMTPVTIANPSPVSFAPLLSVPQGSSQIEVWTPSYSHQEPVFSGSPRQMPIAEKPPRSPENKPASAPSGQKSQTQLELARGLLEKQDGPSPEQSAQAAQLLWVAVQNGNTAAEVDLAKLYLLGEGVPKSCAQARVLLNAAQNRKNELAERSLNDLPKYGCE